MIFGTTIDLPVSAQQKTTDPHLAQYVWDLSSLYPTDAAWEAERSTVLAKIESVGHLKGTLGGSAAALANGLDEISDLRSRVMRMVIFAGAQANVNIRSTVAQAQNSDAISLESRVEEAVAFLPDEVSRIGRERVETWLRLEPRLDRHRIRLLCILREAPHTLPPQEEALVASMASWPHEHEDIFWALQEADLCWPKVKNAAGEAVPVTLGSYIGQFPGRERAAAMQALLGRLRPLQNVFGLLYTNRIEADLTIARHRKFQDGIDALWFLRDGMPENSYHVMVDVARASLPTLRRYLKLLSQASGSARVSYSSLYIPPSGVSRRFTIDEALQTAIASAAPLGSEFQQRMKQAIAGRWMDLPPRPEKRGIFEIVTPPGSHPYLLLSFRSDYASSRRLTGGLIDLMKWADIPPGRGPDTRDDPPSYGNGVIYVGDMLHDDYLYAHSRDRAERIAYLLNALWLYWDNYFFEAVFTELDATVQRLIVEGKTPTGSQISQIYLKLLREYFDDKDGAIVDDAFAAEWMTQSVPFYSYEHQFWAPAIAAAARIMEGFDAGDDNARKAVDEVYRRGDSDRSYDMLRQVGIDLAGPEPYMALIRRMNRQLDELQSLLEQGK